MAVVLPWHTVDTCGYAIKQAVGMLNALLIDGVINPLAVFAGIDYACITQDFHVAGQSRLNNVQVLEQLTGTSFSFLEQHQDSDSAGITKGLKYAGCLFCISHVRSSKLSPLPFEHADTSIKSNGISITFTVLKT